MKMESKAQLNGLRVAPRKIRLLVNLVRGMNVEKAIMQLELSRKDAAKPLLKLINSAIANAVNNHSMQKETLVITEAFVNDGQTLHRWKPRAMGRANPIRKRTSSTTIVITGEVDEKLKVKNEKLKEEKNKKAKKEEATEEKVEEKKAEKKVSKKKEIEK